MEAMDKLYTKICGVTRSEDAELAADLGASAIGFIFWPDSPRFVDPFRARAIVASLPPFVTPVGVFVDQPMEHVEGVASLVRLGAVQLHGRESADDCRRLKHRVIKGMGLTDGAPALVRVFPSHVMILLDAHDPERHGGTGRTIDWAAARRIAATRRVLLSGGLTPENVTTAIDLVRPYGVDVSSGVESRPGVKDPSRLREFFAAVRASAAGVM